MATKPKTPAKADTATEAEAAAKVEAEAAAKVEAEAAAKVEAEAAAKVEAEAEPKTTAVHAVVANSGEASTGVRSVKVSKVGKTTKVDF